MFSKRLLLVFLAVLLLVSTVTASTPTPHLVLSVDTNRVPVGAQFTLHIRYVNLGLPYTTVEVNPPGLVHFDPPLAQPCKYDQHLTGCTTITFRADAPGAVTLRARATGEIFDDTCSCWRWWGGSDDGPVTVIISDTELFLPLIAQP